MGWNNCPTFILTMAKINNSAVMQKLIDELELYPAADVIPTELAEKILPTFQVNSEDITVNPPGSNTIGSSSSVHNNSSVTIYTVPSTGKFFLTNVQLAANSLTATGMASMTVQIKDAASSSNILVFPVYAAAAGPNSSCNSLNLQNPLELEPGSVIQTVSSAVGIYVSGSIVGYTESD